MNIRLAIRGYAGRKLAFEDRVDLPEIELDNLLPELAKKHGEALAEFRLHMIEIEFLDEPNPNERFFRMGTDPRGMVMPVEIDLKKL